MKNSNLLPKRRRRGFTPLERAFLDHFLGLGGQPCAFSASQAVRRAGYSGGRANQAAYRLMQRPRVKQVITRHHNAQVREWARI